MHLEGSVSRSSVVGARGKRFPERHIVSSDGRRDSPEPSISTDYFPHGTFPEPETNETIVRDRARDNRDKSVVRKGTRRFILYGADLTKLGHAVRNRYVSPVSIRYSGINSDLWSGRANRSLLSFKKTESIGEKCEACVSRILKNSKSLNFLENSTLLVSLF